MVFIIIGIVVSLNPHTEEKISFQHNSDVKATGTGPTSVSVKQIVVDVSGAVMKQCIYNLNADSRVQATLNAAGGLSENADRAFVEKKINLAAKLVDGAKLYILGKGESASVVSTNNISVVDQSSTINVNEAMADQWDNLPGIGAVIAQKLSQVDIILISRIYSQKKWYQIVFSGR